MSSIPIGNKNYGNFATRRLLFINKLSQNWGIGRRKSEFDQLSSVHPLDGIHLDRAGFAVHELAEERVDADASVFVKVFDDRERLDRRDQNAQFFANFTDNALVECLIGVPFATRELPVPPQGFIRWPATDQDLFTPGDEGDGDIDNWGRRVVCHQRFSTSDRVKEGETADLNFGRTKNPLSSGGFCAKVCKVFYIMALQFARNFFGSFES